MENNQNIEINLGNIFNKIFKHKIILIAVTLIITILGTLFIGVKGNDKKAVYTSTFSIFYPNSDDLSFPDGSKFQYADIVSLSTLKEIKDKNTAYSNIDVDTMSNAGDITILQAVDNSGKNYTYTISAKKSYFESKEIAKDFIKDLASTPLNKIETIIKEMQYTNYIATYDNLLSYDKKIILFNDQLTELINAYDECIEQFGNITVNNKSLNTHKQEIDTFLFANPIYLLEYEIEANGYAYKSEQLAKEYELEKSILIQRKKVNESKITNLQHEIITLIGSLGSSANLQITELLYPRIAALVEENATLDNEIAILEKKINYANGTKEPNVAFETKLNAYHEKVKLLTEIYTENVISIYENKSSVSFASSSIISESGTSSIIITGIISLIVGLIVAAAISFVIESVKSKKEEPTKENA